MVGLFGPQVGPLLSKLGAGAGYWGGGIHILFPHFLAPEFWNPLLVGGLGRVSKNFSGALIKLGPGGIIISGEKLLRGGINTPGPGGEYPPFKTQGGAFWGVWASFEKQFSQRRERLVGHNILPQIFSWASHTLEGV